ncbi:MAG: 50S ribosomal protein L10 [Actinomycetales bacterium mxb001]|nr:MAG: 50S ribosomal protein L10 [Actinomycetales bacterium mxb001]
MARDDKAATVAELTEEFRTSSAAVLTEYRGLTVSQITQLRRSLKGVANYAVVKNTLTKLAARDAGIEGFDALLTGPSAIAFIKGDPVEGAKSLKNFAKENPLLVLKAGYMDGRILDASEIKKLADLESREVLLAKLAGAMKASMSQAVSLFAAPLSQAARTIDALRVKAEADPSVIGGAGVAAASTGIAAAVGDAVAGVELAVEEVAEAVEHAAEKVAEAVEGVFHHDSTSTEADASPESTTESEG